MPEQQRTEHISQGERQKILAYILLGHSVEPHQNQRVSEKDRVVEERLRGHEHETEK